jgi:hypothetical protein
VFDFTDGAWNTLGRTCGREIPRPFNSTGNRMKVLFRSDNKTTGDGFLVNSLYMTQGDSEIKNIIFREYGLSTAVAS